MCRKHVIYHTQSSRRDNPGLLVWCAPTPEQLTVISSLCHLGTWQWDSISGAQACHQSPLWGQVTVGTSLTWLPSTPHSLSSLSKQNRIEKNLTPQGYWRIPSFHLLCFTWSFCFSLSQLARVFQLCHWRLLEFTDDAFFFTLWCKSILQSQELQPPKTFFTHAHFSFEVAFAPM